MPEEVAIKDDDSKKDDKGKASVTRTSEEKTLLKDDFSMPTGNEIIDDGLDEKASREENKGTDLVGGASVFTTTSLIEVISKYGSVGVIVEDGARECDQSEGGTTLGVALVETFPVVSAAVTAGESNSELRDKPDIDEPSVSSIPESMDKAAVDRVVSVPVRDWTWDSASVKDVRTEVKVCKLGSEDISEGRMVVNENK